MIELLDEMIAAQRTKLLTTARRIIPHITEEDLLQPNDFPALELHPHFRHEEGILDGLQMARAALCAYQREGVAEACTEFFGKETFPHR